MPKAVREKMKIPAKLKVGGRHYKVNYPHNFRERADANGVSYNDKQEMWITGVDGTGEPRPYEGTIIDFIHEVLHAIAFVYGGQDGLFGKDDESVVTVLAEAIFQVLVDNGWLEIE